MENHLPIALMKSPAEKPKPTGMVKVYHFLDQMPDSCHTSKKDDHPYCMQSNHLEIGDHGIINHRGRSKLDSLLLARCEDARVEYAHSTTCLEISNVLG